MKGYFLRDGNQKVLLGSLEATHENNHTYDLNLAQILPLKTKCFTINDPTDYEKNYIKLIPCDLKIIAISNVSFKFLIFLLIVYYYSSLQKQIANSMF